MLLDAFRPGDSSLALRVLATRTGLYKSTILRLLASLERCGAVRREADGAWSPGPALFHWGMLYLRGTGLEARGPALVETLAEETGGIAAFWVRLDAERRLCLLRALPPRAPRLGLAAGDAMAMGAFATAQVFAAWETAFADPDARTGAAVSPGARDGDPTSVSAPVFGPDGAFLGALTVSGSGDRFLDAIERTRILVAEGAVTLTRALEGEARG